MRILTRVLLVVALLVAASVAVLSAGWPGVFRVDALSSIAAALAVVTAALSAWSTQKVIEREEDAQKPRLCLFFDVSSRYNLAQLILRNFGGGPAYDVYVHWDKPLLNHRGETVSFTGRSDGLATPVLVQNESLSAMVDFTSNLAKRPDLHFSRLHKFRC